VILRQSDTFRWYTMEFGDKIAKLRKDLKMSQGDVAKKLDTAPSIIGRYERNEIKPSIEVGFKFAKLFNVTLDYLVDDSDTIAQLKDTRILSRFKEIEKMPDKDKEHFLYLIDALIRDVRTRGTYAS
jgi:transcriptional regulator with XRE-family HTH domain